LGFSKPAQNRIDFEYFTIHTDDKIYHVTDELLRGGWWNENDRVLKRKNKCLYESDDYSDVWALVKRIAKEVEVKACNGRVEFNPHGGVERFVVEGQVMGQKLNEKKLRTDILNAIKSKQHKHIFIDTIENKPKNEKEMIEKIDLRSSFTTYFEDNDNREHNIGLALSKFNGLVVKSGQTISFNQTVGKRSATRGFREAKIILDGEFVPGIGGGVCQVSTTIFNAVLMAGLDIDKSYNHSLAISYVPIGRDAMVSSNADLVFTNNTGGDIYFETAMRVATSKHVGAAIVKIYGNKTNIKYKPRATVTELPIAEGEIDPARKSITYIDAYSGEMLVNSKLVRKSSYKAVKCSKLVS